MICQYKIYPLSGKMNKSRALSIRCMGNGSQEMGQNEEKRQSNRADFHDYFKPKEMNLWEFLNNQNRTKFQFKHKKEVVPLNNNQFGMWIMDQNE